MHETHYRGTVTSVMEQIEKEHDDRRVKGEVTIVVGPSVSRQLELEEELKNRGFNPMSDGNI